jgi:hypothetical protein
MVRRRLTTTPANLGSTTTASELLLQNGVPWTRLSKKSLQTIELIAGPIACGGTQKMVAQSLGWSEDIVTRRLEALRQELTELTLNGS